MADERCVYPEDAESSSGSGAGRNPDRWLDPGTAERLLRGESLETVDAAVRDQAERLAKTLEALTAEPVSAGGALPGEEAALAAFRQVRADRADRAGAERADDWVSPPARGRHRAGARPAGTGRADAGSVGTGPADAGSVGSGRTGPAAPVPADAGLVRIGAPAAPKVERPRRRRPAHLALAAVLAAGVVGGAAAVAGTGILAPAGHGDPGPGTSVTAGVTPDRPLISPTSPVPEIAPSPKGSPSGTAGSRDTARGGTGTTPGKSSEGFGARPDGAWNGAASACRDMRDGKRLSSGRAQSLQDAAGGPQKVGKYCKGVLSGAGSGSATDTGTGTGTQDDPKAAPDDRKSTRDGGDGGDGGSDEDNDRNGSGDGNGHHDGRFTAPGHNNHHGPDGGAATETPLVSHRATMSPTQDPSPNPTYSAL